RNTTDARDVRALSSQRHCVIVRRTDYADLVPGSAQRGDHRLDVHALPVVGLDTMAIEDAQARTRSVAPTGPPIRAGRTSSSPDGQGAAQAAGSELRAPAPPAAEKSPPPRPRPP